MSILEELEISGIRSFGSTTPVRIEFSTPMTLILGHNGSGKTTIIEALRLAATGRMPPNVKTGAGMMTEPRMTCKDVDSRLHLSFLHDALEATDLINQSTGKREKHRTKVLREYLTKYDEKTNAYKFQTKLASQKTAPESEAFKLENTGKTIRDKACKPTSIAQLMGTSSAMLDHVIFCHQEEANWPCDDPTKLKKKLDELFKSTEWAKFATNALKEKRKLSTELDYLKKTLAKQFDDYALWKNFKKDYWTSTVEDTEKQEELRMARLLIRDMNAELATSTEALKETDATMKTLTLNMAMKQRLLDEVEKLSQPGWEHANRSKEGLNSLTDNYKAEIEMLIRSQTPSGKALLELQMSQEKKKELAKRKERDDYIAVNAIDTQTNPKDGLATLKNDIENTNLERDNFFQEVASYRKHISIKHCQLSDVTRRLDLARHFLNGSDLQNAKTKLETLLIAKETRIKTLAEKEAYSKSFTNPGDLEIEARRKLQEWKAKLEELLTFDQELLVEPVPIPDGTCVKIKQEMSKYKTAKDRRERLSEFLVESIQKKSCLLCTKPLSEAEAKEIEQDTEEGSLEMLGHLKSKIQQRIQVVELEVQQAKAAVDKAKTFVQAISKLEAEISETKLAQKFEDQQIETLSSEVTVLEQKMDTCRVEDTKLSREVLLLQEELADLDSRVSAAQESIDTSEKLLITHRAQEKVLEGLQSLEAQIDSINEDIASINAAAQEAMCGADDTSPVESHSSPVDCQARQAFLESELKIIGRYLQIRAKEVEIKELSEHAPTPVFELETQKQSDLTQTVEDLKMRLHKTRETEIAAEVKLQSLQDTVKKLEKTLASRPYFGLPRTILHGIIDHKAIQVAIKDADKFIEMLGRATESHHKECMNQVNKRIQTYWHSAYRGTGIEGLKLNFNATDEDSNSLNKNMNYSLQMTCNGVALDVRSHCSAGQKVLASVVVRMAIAASFNSKCRIMALDEPTTNLDSQSCKHLATALKKLLSTGTDGRVFQFIIITHDTEFLRSIQQDPQQKVVQVARRKERIAWSYVTMGTIGQLN